jgi:putative transposase
VGQHVAVPDLLVQSRRDKHAAKRLMRKLLKKHGRAPRVLITDKLKSYAAADRDLGLSVEHRRHKAQRNVNHILHRIIAVKSVVLRKPFRSLR